MIDVSDWQIGGLNFQYYYRKGWSLVMLEGRLWMVEPIGKSTG